MNLRESVSIDLSRKNLQRQDNSSLSVCHTCHQPLYRLCRICHLPIRYMGGEIKLWAHQVSMLELLLAAPIHIAEPDFLKEFQNGN
jgi:hypothetical protein